jgi:hypothetical protein
MDAVVEQVVAAVKSRDAAQRLEASARLGEYVSARLDEAAAAAPAPSSSGAPDASAQGASPLPSEQQPEEFERAMGTVVLDGERVQVPVCRPLGCNGGWALDAGRMESELASRQNDGGDEPRAAGSG